SQTRSCRRRRLARLSKRVVQLASRSSTGQSQDGITAESSDRVHRSKRRSLRGLRHDSPTSRSSASARERPSETKRAGYGFQRPALLSTVNASAVTQGFTRTVLVPPQST